MNRSFTTTGSEEAAFAALQRNVRGAFPTAFAQIQPLAPGHPGSQEEGPPVLPPALGTGLLARRLAHTPGGNAIRPGILG